MLAITIVLFVVPHNQQIVTIRQFFSHITFSCSETKILIYEKRWTLIVHHLRFSHLRYFVESVHLLLLIDLKAQDLLRLSYYL